MTHDEFDRALLLIDRKQEKLDITIAALKAIKLQAKRMPVHGRFGQPGDPTPFSIIETVDIALEKIDD